MILVGVILALQLADLFTFAALTLGGASGSEVGILARFGVQTILILKVVGIVLIVGGALLLQHRPKWLLLLAAFSAVGVIANLTAFIPTPTAAREEYQYRPIPTDRFVSLPATRTLQVIALADRARVPGRGAAPEADPTPAPTPPQPINPATNTVYPHAISSGIASTYGPGFDGYLALPQGPGIPVRICGNLGCVTKTSNDEGPVPSLHRVADLDVPTFEAVCGPWRMGLCAVTLEWPKP